MVLSALGASWGGLGVSWGRLGASSGRFGASWASLGGPRGHLVLVFYAKRWVILGIPSSMPFFHRFWLDFASEDRSPILATSVISIYNIFGFQFILT